MADALRSANEVIARAAARQELEKAGYTSEACIPVDKNAYSVWALCGVDTIPSRWAVVFQHRDGDVRVVYQDAPRNAYGNLDSAEKFLWNAGYRCIGCVNRCGKAAWQMWRNGSGGIATVAVSPDQQAAIAYVNHTTPQPSIYNGEHSRLQEWVRNTPAPAPALPQPDEAWSRIARQIDAIRLPPPTPLQPQPPPSPATPQPEPEMKEAAPMDVPSIIDRLQDALDSRYGIELQTGAAVGGGDFINQEGVTALRELVEEHKDLLHPAVYVASREFLNHPLSEVAVGVLGGILLDQIPQVRTDQRLAVMTSSMRTSGFRTAGKTLLDAVAGPVIGFAKRVAARVEARQKAEAGALPESIGIPVPDASRVDPGVVEAARKSVQEAKERGVQVGVGYAL